MVTPPNRVRNEHGTHDKRHQYRQGEANRECSPVAVLLSGVENEAIRRLGHIARPTVEATRLRAQRCPNSPLRDAEADLHPGSSMSVLVAPDKTEVLLDV